MKKHLLTTFILSLLLCLTYPTYAEELEQNQPADIPAETVLQIEEDYETAEDPVEAFVARLYNNILQRDADPVGLNAWVNVLKSGNEQGAKVAQGFIESPEFKKRTLTNTEYVQILYRTFLDREADADGLEAWTQVLESGLSRMHVFRGFSESGEFGAICNVYGINRGNVILTAPRDQNEGITKFVVRCYRLCLGREADEDGLNGWCRQILNKANTAKEAAYGFIFSNEFVKRNLSDREYVSTLYKVLMDREGDAAGSEAWVNVLARGESRTHVFNGFADSAEFQKICEGYGISSGSGIPIGNDVQNSANTSGNNAGNNGNINSGSSGAVVDNTTVYYVPNGEKYHKTSRCTTLKRSTHIYSTTRDRAQASGRRPCKVCYR